MVCLVAPDTQSAIQQLQQLNCFLITSTGRTATKWLATLLNQAEGAYVEHEPMLNEQDYHSEAILSPNKALSYIRDFRVREMALRVREQNPIVYGEVNSSLRFHIKAIQTVLPSLGIIHLVRDGREVVRSVINRRIQRSRGQAYHSIQPPVVDEFSARWDRLSVFEQTCWGWQYENSCLRENIQSCVRFEDLRSSFELLTEQVLVSLGLTLNQDVWEKSIRQPINITQEYSFPHWKDWSSEMKEQFRCICGREMEIYGYAV